MSKLLKYLFIFFPILLGALIYLHTTVFALPSNFSRTEIATAGFNFPTGFAFAPDGRIFVLEQGGWVKVISNNQVLDQPFITLDVDTNGERGLVGIAIDPQFSQNHYIYLTYVNKNPLELRVSRFTELNGQAVAGSEVILLKSTQQLNLIHMSGTLRFGPDGKLWITIGNNEIKANSQDLSNIHGKILRINKDGSIPSDNPFFGQSGRRGEIWAYGLRNPFRFNFLPDGRPILGDVGDDKNEEINIITKGGNYGYPNTEGPCSCQYIDPLYYYPHGEGAAVVGGYTNTGDAFPTEYKNSYFFADYVNGFIKRMQFDSQGNFVGVESFDDGAGPVVDLQQGPNGNMYYLTLYGEGGFMDPGNLWTVGYGSSGNQAPVAKAGAGPISGALPLKVYFWSESTDADGDQLGYTWDFGDGTASTEANPTHTYTTKGIYKAKLTVFDGQASNTSQEIEIAAGYSEPTLRITTPENGYKYNAGDTINYYGVGWDAEDGNLPDSAYSWKVLFHHGEHVHPFLADKIGQFGSFVIPTSGEPSADTWYEIFGTVTDSQGLTKTVSNSIYPNKVTVTFQTDPAGLNISLDGQPTGTPQTFEAVVGSKRTVDAPDSQVKNNENFQFESWSDGGAKTHVVTIPNTNKSYTAKFKSLGAGTSNIRFRIAQFSENSSWQNNYLNGITAKLTDRDGNTVYATAQSGTQFGNENGWVFFDNIPAGSYGIMAYKSGYEGIWKKLDCTNSAGSFTDAVITNQSSERFKAAWNNSVTVSGGQTSWCTDLGLKQNNKGSLRFRILNIETNTNGYSVNGFINGATAKLTDPAGTNVISTGTSFKRDDGEDGWVQFDNFPAGTYGLMAYKSGYSGFLKKISCSIEDRTNATIQNSNTQGLTAAWNNNVVIAAGKITYCYDLGLTSSSTSVGSVRLRVAEFSTNNSWLNKYINGATVKLTDVNGASPVAAGSTGTQFGTEDGWVFLDNVPVGTYGVMAYKSGLEGVWKKLDCTDSAGSFSNATIQNPVSENILAAWNNNVTITSGQTTWCTDLGLKAKQSAQTGNLRVRVAELGASNNWLNNYLNDVTVKITSTDGNQEKLASKTGNQFGNEAGWAFFDNIPVGNYGVMAYKSGYEGAWKKLDCDNPGGSFDNVTINNLVSENTVAAWNNNVTLTTGQTLWCVDFGIKKKV